MNIETENHSKKPTDDVGLPLKKVRTYKPKKAKLKAVAFKKKQKKKSLPAFVSEEKTEELPNNRRKRVNY